MLRRAPTTIQLTQADIDQYEANQQRKIFEQNQVMREMSTPETTASAKDDGSSTADVQQAQARSQKTRIMGAARGN